MKSRQDAEYRLDTERLAALLAKRVADRVADSLMKAGFNKELAASMLRALEKKVKEEQGE